MTNELTFTETCTCGAAVEGSAADAVGVGFLRMRHAEFIAAHQGCALKRERENHPERTIPDGMVLDSAEVLAAMVNDKTFMYHLAQAVFNLMSQTPATNMKGWSTSGTITTSATPHQGTIKVLPPQAPTQSITGIGETGVAGLYDTKEEMRKLAELVEAGATAKAKALRENGKSGLLLAAAEAEKKKDPRPEAAVRANQKNRRRDLLKGLGGL